MPEESKSEIPEEFFCEMTKKIMRDPMVSRYGNHFEREAILKWINDGNHYCPVSGQGMLILKSLIERCIREYFPTGFFVPTPR